MNLQEAAVTLKVTMTKELLESKAKVSDILLLMNECWRLGTYTIDVDNYESILAKLKKIKEYDNKTK